MDYKKKVFISFLVAFSVLPASKCNVPPGVDTTAFNQGKTLGDCQACTKFIQSFNRGLDRTARGKYEGGDAAWEEEKLKKSYRRSEMRLVDIQEGLCKEESTYSVQCHHMAERAEEYIEQWWAQDPDESDDLHSSICIEKLKVCCPVHHYGKDCTPCPGDHNNLCNGNGKCRGDGTRKGNGTCLCDPPYVGEDCNECGLGFYLSYEDDNKILCSPCHEACMGGCQHGSPKDCIACTPGYRFDLNEGCVDIDECEFKICTNDEFCLNSIGSYICLPCDKACKGCDGDGPDLCQKCAKDYIRKEKFCIPDGHYEDSSSDLLSNGRCVSYIGLLIATVILLLKSPRVGAAVGTIVLAYMVCAEYYCMLNGYRGLINLKKFDITQFFRSV